MHTKTICDMSSAESDILYCKITKPQTYVTSCYKDLKESSLVKNVEKHRSWEAFKDKVSMMKEFQPEEFRSAFHGLKKIFDLKLLETIVNTDPTKTQSVFENLPTDVKLNIAALIDLIMICPNGPRLLEWVGRYLSRIDCRWDDLICNSEIKSVCLLYRKENYKSPQKPGPLCWGVLKKGNYFHVYQADSSEMKEVTKPKETSTPCDIIATSRSGNSVKVQRDLQHTMLVFIPESNTWDRNLWEREVLRKAKIPYYYAMRCYSDPMPQELLKPALEVIQSPGMFIARSLLKSGIVRTGRSPELVNAFWTVYSESGRLHEFITTVAANEFMNADVENPTEIMRKDSFLTDLQHLIFGEYGKDYKRNVLSKVYSLVVDACTAAVDDAENVFNLLTNIINTVTENMDAIPPEIRHFMAVVVHVVSLHYKSENAVRIALVSMFFLRFSVPFLTYPGEYIRNDVELSVVSKMASRVQRFANFQDFEDAYLVQLNPRLVGLRKKMADFLFQIPDMRNPPNYRQYTKEDVLAGTNCIIKFVSTYWDKFSQSIKKELQSQERSPAGWAVMHFLRSLANIPWTSKPLPDTETTKSRNVRHDYSDDYNSDGQYSETEEKPNNESRIVMVEISDSCSMNSDDSASDFDNPPPVNCPPRRTQISSDSSDSSDSYSDHRRRINIMSGVPVTSESELPRTAEARNQKSTTTKRKRKTKLRPSVTKPRAQNAATPPRPPVTSRLNATTNMLPKIPLRQTTQRSTAWLTRTQTPPKPTKKPNSDSDSDWFSDSDSSSDTQKKLASSVSQFRVPIIDAPVGASSPSIPHIRSLASTLVRKTPPSPMARSKKPKFDSESSYGTYSGSSSSSNSMKRKAKVPAISASSDQESLSSEETRPKQVYSSSGDLRPLKAKHSESHSSSEEGKKSKTHQIKKYFPGVSSSSDSF